MTLSPDRLRSAREAAGLSQVEAAESAGVSRATLQNAETGKWSPRADTLARLAALYRVRIDDLFAHEVDAATPAPSRVHGAPETQKPAANLPRYSVAGSK